MPMLIKNNKLSLDNWTTLKQVTDPEVLKLFTGKNLIVPLEFWHLYRSELEKHIGETSIWLESDENVNNIGEDLLQFSIVALNFPVFSDGRSYTNARELRNKFGYQGEIRAIGDVLRDQLFYMARCGFDAFQIRYDQDPDLCIAAFKDFDTGYQSSIDEPNPLFRRR